MIIIRTNTFFKLFLKIGIESSESPEMMAIDTFNNCRRCPQKINTSSITSITSYSLLYSILIQLVFQENRLLLAFRAFTSKYDYIIFKRIEKRKKRTQPKHDEHEIDPFFSNAGFSDCCK